MQYWVCSLYELLDKYKIMKEKYSYIRNIRIRTMDKLNFPIYAFKVTGQGDEKKIFDEVRKKYIVLTPEEWVRQHIIRYLIKEKNYPSGLFNVETGLKYNGRAKRTDIVVYNPLGEVVVIVECKAPGVTINQDPFDQIAMYNKELQGQYLIVTNGMSHYCCKMDYENGEHQFLEEIPDYMSISEITKNV